MTECVQAEVLVVAARPRAVGQSAWMQQQQSKPNLLTVSLNPFCVWVFPPCHLQRGIVASGEHAGKVVVKVSERFFRPAEVDLLLGEPSKAREVLGWDPDKMTSVEKLCEEMVDSDIELAKMELAKNDLKKKLKVRCTAQLAGCGCSSLPGAPPGFQQRPACHTSMVISHTQHPIIHPTGWLTVTNTPLCGCLCCAGAILSSIAAAGGNRLLPATARAPILCIPCCRLFVIPHSSDL